MSDTVEEARPPITREPDAYRPGRFGQIAHVFRDEGIARVVGLCTVTHKEYSIEVPLAGYVDWQNGAYIQEALGSVPPAQREFLISGTSPEGFEKLFGKDGDAESGDDNEAD